MRHKNHFVGDDLWNRLEHLARRSPKTAAVAYVSDSTIRFGKGDVLITDASRRAIQTGQTSATALVVAQKRGAAVYSLPRLHAKLLLTGAAAFIGSSNLSHSSRQLLEAGIITTDRGLRSRVRQYLNRLQKLAGRALTA